MTLPELIRQLRADLVEEATPNPSTNLAYGRPHEHPRSRSFPRYTPTGVRLPGAVHVAGDCSRPVRGRCDCPPDGSWRPAVGVIRADSTAVHKRHVGARDDVVQPIGFSTWVDEVYEQGRDGLWRCRWPVRRALERLRGASVRRWATALRLLRGDALSTVWGADGAPPDPLGEALRILGDVDRWAKVEREAEWERRPRQWWDRPRRKKSNERSREKSESQEIADATGLTGDNAAATPTPEDRNPLARRIGRGREVEQPSGTTGARTAFGHPIPCSPEGCCV